MMFNNALLVAVLALGTSVTATLDPATSNSKGQAPSALACKPGKVSKAIQAAECSHNTRVRDQTFAVFTTDHQYDRVHGAPYGTCEAYSCKPSAGTKGNADKWTFYWNAAGVKGKSSGEGVGCIKSPDDGKCGCENSSDGVFIPGGTNCV